MSLTWLCWPWMTVAHMMQPLLSRQLLRVCGCRTKKMPPASYVALSQTLQHWPRFFGNSERINHLHSPSAASRIYREKHEKNYMRYICISCRCLLMYINCIHIVESATTLPELRFSEQGHYSDRLQNPGPRSALMGLRRHPRATRKMKSRAPKKKKWVVPTNLCQTLC